MAEAIVSGVLEQLISIIGEEIKQEVKLVVGVDDEVKKLRRNLEDIDAVLVDAEERQVKEKTVSLWLDRLKHASYDIENVLDEWNYAMLKQQIEGAEDAAAPKKKVCFFFPSSCFLFKRKIFKQISFKQMSLRHGIAKKIKQVNENLDVIAKQKDMYKFNVSRSVGKSDRVQSTSFIDVSNICGRDEDKNTLVRMLCESSKQHPHIISIIGMGGIGKTTLAQFAYKNNEVTNNFNEVMWVCVSEPFDEYRIAKAIIEALERSVSNSLKSSASNSGELESLFQDISKSISGKKFLLILDDVWSDDYKKWEPLYHCLKSGDRGSKILITTRKESVARMMESFDVVAVKELPDEECWLLFSRFAFVGKSQEECENLEEIGKKILKKCKGLPLAAKTIGSLLRDKKTKEQWLKILESDLWKLEECEKDIFGPLLLSYNDLSFKIKRCFTYCVIFPKDHKIEKDYLIKLWMANGYLNEVGNNVMEIIGEEYFDCIASRSLFQEFEKDDHNNIVGCKMHDLVHDFVQFLTKNECLHVEVNDFKESVINSSYNEQICHLMITFDKQTPFPDSIYSLKRLRNFVCCYFEHSAIDFPSIMSSKLFGELTSLKALSFSKRETREKETWERKPFFRVFQLYSVEIQIPKEIGKLIHLRYLDLKYLNMRKLPEELCGLYNLQTLNISYCLILEELPQGIGKLKNLRHLENFGLYSLRYMPIGIQRLTNLRTLNSFVVGNDNKVCSLESLKYFNLFGELYIVKLGNVSNMDEARRSELKNQKNLIDLSLDFVKDEGEMMNEDSETLLEILQPPLNLEKLEVCNYNGNTIFPNWMMSLTKLRHLILSSSKYCKHLPPLGKLSSLESLTIESLTSLKRVSNEFLGIESDGTSSSFIFFPKLKTLSFVFMNEWEEWDYEITRKGEEEDDITIMPSLVFLEIHNCPKLKALPSRLVQRTTLKKRISGCPLLGDYSDR